MVFWALIFLVPYEIKLFEKNELLKWKIDHIVYHFSCLLSHEGYHFTEMIIIINLLSIILHVNMIFSFSRCVIKIAI